MLSLFSFWHPSDANVVKLEVVSEAAYTTLIWGEFFFLLVVLIDCFLLPYVPIMDLVCGFIHSTIDSL